MKLTKFEAETNVNGAFVKVSSENGVLSFEGIRAEDVAAFVQHAEKFKNAATATKVTPKPRVSKPAPVAAPSEAKETNGAANGKVHHLPTPAELQAKKEAPKVKLVCEAPGCDQPGKERPNHGPHCDAHWLSLVGATSEPKPQAQFVEDLEVHQAVDQGKRVKDGKEPPPKELAEAKSLKEVLLYFHEHHKLASNEEMLEACGAWREQVPVLQRIDLKSLKLRVTTTTDTLGLWKD